MSDKKLTGALPWRLDELFSGEHRAIVIPDLQRDYCWGDPVHTCERKDLVRDFVTNLVELFVLSQSGRENTQRDSDFNLGLIYGYEQPSEQIQLCDGQQRITTLYLLIGMLNRYLGDDSLKKYLISKYEENDDKEPYLRYSIRESSLYFMSDLVCRYFVRGENHEWPLATESIRGCEWYYNDYDQDPSIQSILRALDIIEDVMKRPGVDWRDFAKFIIKRLTFMYYDMGSRENGEETFVVINTTGEPLSAAQNLKPKVVTERINESEDDLVEKWEEVDTWYWNHRTNGNDTSDIGFGEFLRWVTLLHYIETSNDEIVSSVLESGTFAFPFAEVPFAEIYSKFNAVRKIYEKYSSSDDSLADQDYLSPTANKQGRLDLIDLYKFLPVVRYIERFEDAEIVDVRRIFRYFKNLSEYLGKDITIKNQSLSQAVRLVNAMSCKDILSFLDCKGVSKHILPDEERRKLRILAESGGGREAIEESFWEAQALRIFDGEITPLLDWSMQGDDFEFRLFKTYVAMISTTIEADGVSRDLVRRAWLSLGLSEYPVRNGKNLSFCGEDWQWKKVASENSGLVKNFLDELIGGEDINAIIARCPKSSKWYAIASDAAVLNYCENKNVQEDAAEGVILIKKIRATTWFPMRLLEETRSRFGAERILNFHKDGRCDWVGFTKTINGRVRYFQRWLLPDDGQGDLYIMRSDDPNSYVEGDDPNGNNDFSKFRCMKVTDEMDNEDISKGILALIEKCNKSHRE